MGVENARRAPVEHDGAWRIDAERVHAVMRQIAPHIRHTPLVPSPSGGFVKLESLQPTGSFKVRGFFAAALAIEPEQRARGLLTVSAGNSALACAYVAHHLQVPCRVVMVETAPTLKVKGVRALGGQVVLLPFERMHEWIKSRSWEDESEVFVHPFADDAVITGHATIVPEILEDCPEVERVFVPVGGGGLVSGIAGAFATLQPDVQVVGVQSDGYPLWPRAFAAGGPVSLTPNTIADGTTAPFNPVMFGRLSECVGEWIVVPEAAVQAAVARLATELKVVAEGAGALAFAAMVSGRSTANTVAILSGGNIDPTRLGEILSRSPGAADVVPE
jgi:threonine dehydratase